MYKLYFISDRPFPALLKGSVTVIRDQLLGRAVEMS